MSDGNPAGPPIRLLTHNERKRRRRVITAAVVIGTTFAALVTFAALNVATKPNADAHLGSTTFRVGFAVNLEKRIAKDAYPLLFQDLQNKSIDIFLTHKKGADFLEGWQAIEAHAPDRPRTCQLTWTGSGFKDPCDSTVYPSDGEGLRRFQVNVVKGEVYVNFRVLES